LKGGGGKASGKERGNNAYFLSKGQIKGKGGRDISMPSAGTQDKGKGALLIPIKGGASSGGKKKGKNWTHFSPRGEGTDRKRPAGKHPF